MGSTVVHLAVGHGEARVDIARDVRVGDADEAATMQRIRKHLFDERGFARSHGRVRGYWKHTTWRSGIDPECTATPLRPAKLTNWSTDPGFSPNPRGDCRGTRRMLQPHVFRGVGTYTLSMQKMAVFGPLFNLDP